MNNSYKNWFKGGLLSVMTVLGMVACTDDHYDIVEPGETAKKTIWQNIQENENLSDFAAVLSATSYLKNDMDFPTASAKMSYADYLNSPQSLTVWAPINGSFDVEEMLLKLEVIKAKYSEDPKAATKEEYIFASQFLGQHIARFNHESQGEDKRVRMLNAKYIVYDASAKTFDGIALLDDEATLTSSNGTLHLLSTASVYAYNVFDFLSSTSELSKINSVFTDKEFDITSFSPGMSTEGALNSDGKMEYVDSVYTNYNTLLNMANAQLKNEDSVYVAVFPTDEAYDDALAVVKSMFNYKNGTYKNYKGTGKWEDSETLKSGYNFDSLAELNAKKLLFSSMFFSPSIMGKDMNIGDSEAIINYCLYNDSVKTTNGKTIYSKKTADGKNPFFLGDNNEDVEPIKVSNGYVFAVNRYNLDPAYSFIERRETGVTTIGAVTNGYAKSWSLGADDKNDSIADRFDVKNFMRYELTQKGDLKFQVELPSLKSGKYKIYALLVPTAAHNGIELDYTEQLSFDVKVFDPADTKAMAMSEVSAPSDRVEKVLLFDELNLEYSYDGLPDGVRSFPYLQFELLTSYQYDNTGKPLCSAINIAKIIIEPYREESTND